LLISLKHLLLSLFSTLSTTPQCKDCQCIGGTCKFNVTLGRCHCQCQDFVFGDFCTFGQNDTSVHIVLNIPEQFQLEKANFTLKIQITFEPAYNDLSSPQSLEFIEKLERELEGLCKEADPETFKKVQVIKLSPGSVVAESVAEYIYPNNETQIQFVNTQLDGVLVNILNDTSNLKNISQAFNNSAVQLNGFTFQPPEITNITDLKPFVNCSHFANYTAEIINGQWQCIGPCKTNPDYCHQHGECHNNIHKGPTCRCFESSLQQFYGPQCDLFRRGPGFYGALFGSLAAALLLLIIIVIAVIVKKRHMRVWRRSNSYKRRLSAFEEDFFDFSDTGDHNLGFAGTYTSKVLGHI
ncbi:mucin-3A, partial [Sander vitreus]